MSSFKEFLDYVLLPSPSLRQGQKLISVLQEIRPDLYERIMYDPRDLLGSGAGHDCFYDDSKVWGTIQWIRDNW